MYPYIIDPYIHISIYPYFHVSKETKRRLDSEDKEVKEAPSPAVKAAHKKKQETYALMLSIAEKQAANGSRVTPPLFFPAVVSTHGEFCEGMVSLQEWLTSN